MGAQPKAPLLRLPEDFTPTARRALLRADPALGPWMRGLGPLRFERGTSNSPFAALARSIIYQQLHGKAAATILSRVLLVAGEKGHLHPERLLAASPESLRAAGLSGNKSAALLDLSAKALDGTVPTLARARKMSDEELKERLTAVRGVGNWTVEMFLLFHLGRPDVWPVDDFAIRRGWMLMQKKTEMPKPRELLAFGERWRPWRSVVSWYLWRSLDVPQKDSGSSV